ncbi:hypothetical protein CC1G_01699 [Coprinopsis cinerea okayama7|uniref:Uncharacterized protein n=1 Tax=Coprinopsis cinerea (strain Okayama-7 / 130 / ATCC MYA-4618 / FGSC 9003) TaxID=240176 RepID=A8N2A0_COPC7|nr:hypothetical protein CC1G_01699 [Coprinopsis cinerea okayama7\|eukprot:XP_001829019.2 hypothetical protein CC1G_01699 [Coprinopsis cinerea okayama7\
MKFQQPWQGTNSGQFSGKLRAMWDKITFSRLTIFYFAFTIIHFAIQFSLQIRAFTINAEAAYFLDHILEEGNAKSTSLPFQTKSTERPPSAEYPSSFASTSSKPSVSTTTIFVRPVSTAPQPTGAIEDDNDDDDDDNDDGDNDVDEDEDDGGIDRPRVPVVSNQATTRNSLGATQMYKREHSIILDGETVTLSDTCLDALNWPASQLHNTKREDIVFIAFQFWVLGMSFIALLNESIPHILASLLTHVMVTAWVSFQVTQTEIFRRNFNRIITNGACRGTNLLPDFWKARALAEYPSLALHAVALIVSCVLTWKLVKLYGWQTFKRVGASLKINRIYKIMLILSVTIQLSLFFMLTTVCLWIDQLFNSAIGDIASFTTLYKVSSFITLALLVPWLMMGWFAVRRELRLPMFFFLVLSILYLTGWGVMFFSTTFRWTFVTWRFFAVMASASVFLTCVSFIFGIICRFNFGKGLLKYLDANDSVVEDDRSSVWNEKRDLEHYPFPSVESLVPTFSSAYGSQDHYVQGPTASQGPRFFQSNPEPYETGPPGLASPPRAVTRNLNDVPQMRRSDSSGSEKSHASFVREMQSRGSDHMRKGSQSSSQSSKRWVIE